MRTDGDGRREKERASGSKFTLSSGQPNSIFEQSDLPSSRSSASRVDEEGSSDTPLRLSTSYRRRRHSTKTDANGGLHHSNRGFFESHAHKPEYRVHALAMSWKRSNAPGLIVLTVGGDGRVDWKRRRRNSSPGRCFILRYPTPPAPHRLVHS